SLTRTTGAPPTRSYTANGLVATRKVGLPKVSTSVASGRTVAMARTRSRCERSASSAMISHVGRPTAGGTARREQYRAEHPRLVGERDGGAMPQDAHRLVLGPEGSPAADDAARPGPTAPAG